MKTARWSSGPEAKRTVGTPRKQPPCLVIEGNAVHFLLAVAPQAGELPQLQVQHLHGSIAARHGHGAT